VILDIPDDLGSTVIYSEGHAGETFLDGVTDVDTYEDVFTEVSGRALTPHASRDVVRRYHDDFAPREARSP
jgi:hypothetical protein